MSTTENAVHTFGVVMVTVCTILFLALVFWMLAVALGHGSPKPKIIISPEFYESLEVAPAAPVVPPAGTNEDGFEKEDGESDSLAAFNVIV